MAGDARNIGSLKYTAVADAERRFGNTVRHQGVVDAVVPKVEQLGDLLEGQELVHLGSRGFGAMAVTATFRYHNPQRSALGREAQEEFLREPGGEKRRGRHGKDGLRRTVVAMILMLRTKLR